MAMVEIDRLPGIDRHRPRDLGFWEFQDPASDMVVKFLRQRVQAIVGMGDVERRCLHDITRRNRPLLPEKQDAHLKLYVAIGLTLQHQLVIAAPAEMRPDASACVFAGFRCQQNDPGKSVMGGAAASVLAQHGTNGNRQAFDIELGAPAAVKGQELAIALLRRDCRCRKPVDHKGGCPAVGEA